MSKFKDYSLPELYGNTNVGPQNPANINWKSVAVYGGLALGTAIIFGLLINHAMNTQMKQWQLHSEKMNQQYTDTIERQGAIIQKLTEQISAGKLEQAPEKGTQVENSIKA